MGSWYCTRTGRPRCFPGVNLGKFEITRLAPFPQSLVLAKLEINGQLVLHPHRPSALLPGGKFG
jgi:hypothetical protein